MKKSKSMGPKQILAYIAFLIAVVWSLKFVFELTSSGVKQITSSSERKICEFNFQGKRYTGKADPDWSIQMAELDCSEFGMGLGCEKTAGYNNALEEYDQCLASGGKKEREDSMSYCASESEEVSSEIRGQYYKDCMKSEGW